MKVTLNLLGLTALFLIGTGSAVAGPDLSGDEFATRYLATPLGCAKNEIGKITKVDVVSGKEVAKLTKGQLKVDPTKKFAVIRS